MPVISAYKLLRIILLGISISILNASAVFCQIFDDSQNPPGLKWRQINTPGFQVIYPAALENDGQRMASVLTSIIGREERSIHITPRKIAVILQNQGTTANGFVQLAPRRSEFFTTPSQEFDDQEWLNSLAVHELRHVVQFDKLTGKLRAPFEDLALALFGITLPPWFYEGDAVVTETALTDAGRGRQPEFDLVMRTNTLSGRKYSYAKDYLGSVKDFTAGYYPLGFYMVAKLRRDHGPDIIDSVLTRLAQHPLRPYNLSSAIKHFTGMNTRGLHDSTILTLEKFWKTTQERTMAMDYPDFVKRKNHEPVSYYMPAGLPGGEIAALKQGLGKAAALVKMDSMGRETVIRKIGLQEDPYFRYRAGKFTWDEFRYDTRYQQRSYNVIMLMDEATGKTNQLTHKSRLFAPDIAPDGKTVAAIAISYANRIAVVELDLSGKELRHFDSPGNDMLQTPSYSPDGRHLVVTAVNDKGKTLYTLDLNSGIFTQLFPYQHQLISKPVYFGKDTIIFKSDRNGIDNLVVLSVQNNRFSALTAVKFGAYNPSWDQENNRVLFNNYGPDGLGIAAISSIPAAIASTPGVRQPPDDYILPIALQEGSSNVFDSIAVRSYVSRPYHELGNLLNFHSLVPIIEKNDLYNATDIGLKLQSDNKLNTLSLYTGYRFNNALKKNEYLAGMTYSRFYPVFSLSYLNRARFYQQQQLLGSVLSFVPINWREHMTEANMSIPFDFNRLNHLYNITAQVGTSYVTRYNFSNKPLNFVNRLRFPMVYRAYFNHNTKRSPRDLAPRWGQTADLLYRHFPFEKSLKGNILSLKTNLYFPGLFTNHTLQVSFNAQHATGNYAMVTDIPLVNGYNSLSAAGALKNTLLTNYQLPLFYPDWQVGSLAYIKRFSGGFFADFENVYAGNRFSPRSYGLEVKADMNLLRFYLPDVAIGTKIIFHNDPVASNPIIEAGITYTY